MTSIMSAFGYISSTAQNVVQPESAITAIANIYKFSPILIWGTVLIVGLLYQLDKKYPSIMQELAAREMCGEL